MMGQQDRDQGQLFYEFRLDELIPQNHLLRRMKNHLLRQRTSLWRLCLPICAASMRPRRVRRGRTRVSRLQFPICKSLFNEAAAVTLQKMEMLTKHAATVTLRKTPRTR